MLEKPPVWPIGLKPVSTTAALWRVAGFAGARPADCDSIDRWIVAGALSGTAQIIDSQEAVDGYPKHAPTNCSLTVPDEGRHEWLEKLAREVTFGNAR